MSKISLTMIILYNGSIWWRYFWLEYHCFNFIVFTKPALKNYFCLQARLQHSQCSFHLFDLIFRIAEGLFKLVFNNMFMYVNVRSCTCTKSRVPNNSKYENLWKVLWNTPICPQQCKKMVPMSLTQLKTLSFSANRLPERWNFVWRTSRRGGGSEMITVAKSKWVCLLAKMEQCLLVFKNLRPFAPFDVYINSGTTKLNPQIYFCL